MQRTCVDMHDVPAKERFAFWREAVCQTYLPLDPEELVTESFNGKLQSVSGTTLLVSRVRTIASAVRRTRSGIRKLKNGAFFANLQISGEAIVEQHGITSLARAGDIVLVDTDQPFSIRFEQGCNIICAMVPGHNLRRHRQRLARQPIAVIPGRGTGRLAAAYLNGLEDIPEEFELVDDLASDQLSALLVRATAIDQRGGAAPGAQRSVTLQRIQTFILDELHNPQLSAKLLCHHLKISRSHLFAVLAEAGLSFAPHIRQQRLRRSLDQISDPRFADQPISEIALRWGFSDGAAFSRCFKHEYGVPPSTYRLRGRAPPAP